MKFDCQLLPLATNRHERQSLLGLDAHHWQANILFLLFIYRFGDLHFRKISNWLLGECCSRRFSINVLNNIPHSSPVTMAYWVYSMLSTPTRLRVQMDSGPKSMHFNWAYYVVTISTHSTNLVCSTKYKFLRRSQQAHPVFALGLSNQKRLQSGVNEITRFLSFRSKCNHRSQINHLTRLPDSCQN